MERRRRGRPATGRSGSVGRIYMPDAYWQFLGQWEGDNWSQKLVNALDSLAIFKPEGPYAAKRRDCKGRFLPHETLTVSSLHRRGEDG